MLEVALPALPPEWLAAVVLAFFAGAACPAYYAQERLRGFGRTMVDRLPYKPPPGMDGEEALYAAAEGTTDIPDEETVKRGR